MNKKILIVAANYYPKITSNLILASKRKVYYKSKNKIVLIKVPGIFEIPMVISKNINKFDGFIALGCVIKGETPHFDFISKSTISGLMSLSIKYKKPIGNGIITCLNKKQSIDRSMTKGKKLSKNKGLESANAVLELLSESFSIS